MSISKLFALLARNREDVPWPSLLCWDLSEQFWTMQTYHHCFSLSVHKLEYFLCPRTALWEYVQKIYVAVNIYGWLPAASASAKHSWLLLCWDLSEQFWILQTYHHCFFHIGLQAPIFSFFCPRSVLLRILASDLCSSEHIWLTARCGVCIGEAQSVMLGRSIHASAQSKLAAHGARSQRYEQQTFSPSVDSARFSFSWFS